MTPKLTLLSVKPSVRPSSRSRFHWQHARKQATRNTAAKSWGVNPTSLFPHREDIDHSRCPPLRVTRVALTNLESTLGICFWMPASSTISTVNLSQPIEALRRRHDIFFGRATVPGGWSWRATRAGCENLWTRSHACLRRILNLSVLYCPFRVLTPTLAASLGA
jgi:hypothetical protein